MTPTFAVTSNARPLPQMFAMSEPWQPSFSPADRPAGSMGQGLPLAGKRILIVEDDFLLSMALELELQDQGADVVGIASSLAKAMAWDMDQKPFDCAVLDIDLNGERVFPFALHLLARDVPFVFVSAFAQMTEMFPEALRTMPRLGKPYRLRALVAALTA